FMPKPIKGDNGSGMHTHQSIWKGDRPAFAGNLYADLSETALYYIGGILRHAKALNAFTNPTTNSYKRLIPGFEAPVLLAYSARNRSAGCRIPIVSSPKAKRVEVRYPDPACNPYLAFAAMMMAGLDGVQNRIHPGDAMDKNLYDLPPEELKEIPTVCGSLREAIGELQQDHAFLTKAEVFDRDFLEAYMDLGLHGKHAIVTGGSRGIGKAIARELAREGADVAIVARNKADLEASARELAAETNRRIVPLAADVTSKEQVERMVAEAAQQL